MRFTKDQILDHLDSIIMRQIEEIEMLVDTKPKPISTLRRSRAHLDELVCIRDACNRGDAACQGYLNQIEQDMLMIGWGRE
jgi:hypothetical protein